MSEVTTDIHGWGCTPTIEQPPAPKFTFLRGVLFRGWQRTVLYSIIIVLILLIFLNIALTLWIIASLRLSMTNIGPIKIVKGGIQLNGESFMLGRLVASNVTSRAGHPLLLHSHRNFTVLVSNPDTKENSRLSIKRDSIECEGATFDIMDGKGKSIFRASREEVRVLADSFVVDSDGGLTVRNAVQTSAVRAPPGSDLFLESQTRRLELRAPQSIHVESRAGGIDISSHGNIELNSDVGAIHINAQNVYINKLKEGVLLSEKVVKNKQSKPMKVYQVCVCASSGKMFLAAPDGLCAAHTDDHDLCR